MSFIETIKEAAGSVVEAIKENPGTAAAIAGGAVVVGGTIWFWRRRKKNAANVEAVIGHAEQVAVAGNPALAAAAEKATA